MLYVELKSQKCYKLLSYFVHFSNSLYLIAREVIKVFDIRSQVFDSILYIRACGIGGQMAQWEPAFDS